MDLLTSLLGRNGFLPHGYCFNWTGGLLWTMVAADLLIALAYFSIPLAIVSLARRRTDLRMGWLPALFSAFIFACGVTHVMDVWTIWQPDYVLQALTKVATAAVSVATALALWPLIPKAAKIPSAATFGRAMESLHAESEKRRSAEELLLDAEINLAATLATIGAAFIASDRAGHVVRMNAVAEQLTGWTQAQAIGQPLFEVFQREGRPADLADQNPVDLVEAQGAAVDVSHEVVLLARGGGRIPVDARVALTRNADGSKRGLALVFRDMSRLLQAEAESNRLSALVESSFDAIIGKTLAGVITSWNAAAEQLFGYSAAEAIGQPVQMLIPADRLDEEMRILTDLSRGARVPAFDTVRRAKDGRLLQLSVTISPIRDASGQIVGASKIARDIGAQRRAEAALHDSEARLRFALEAARIGDWDLDLATGSARRSLRHDQCFGHQQLLPHWTLDTFFHHVHPLDRREVAESFNKALARHTTWHAQHRVIWADSSVHWLSIHGQVMIEDAAARRMIGIVSDITDQREADEARLRVLRLEAENLQMHEASRLKSQFLANMSHELRTPLNAIIGFADLLGSGAVPEHSPKRAHFLGLIGSGGRHLLQMINDVLDLAKVESGKFEFYPEPIDLDALVREIQDVLQAGLMRKHLQFSVDIDPALTDLVLDPARLKQVLFNFLSNAIKFTPEGGRIAVRARAAGPHAFRLEVEDSGIGIAASDIPRLFSEFQQLDAGYSKQHQGTGLGLALTRRLVEAQGGSVGVRSTDGAGSVFHVLLSRAPGSAGGLPDEDGRPGALDALARLLVIEHDPVLSTRLTGLLGEAGFEVDVCGSGELATLRVRQQRYDGIALELLLGLERGLGVLAEIRNVSAASGESPVVGVTVDVGAGSAAAFAIADVLCKPIRSDEVAAAIKRLPGHAAGPPTVLIIDDDLVALDLMGATLTALGIPSVGRQDGRQALAEIDALRPDAIVLDLMMPGFDGFAVLDALNALEAWKHTPVFIWTSMTLGDDEYAALARSARAIAGKGGGDARAMMEALQRRHGAAPPDSRVSG